MCARALRRRVIAESEKDDFRRTFLPLRKSCGNEKEEHSIFGVWLAVSGSGTPRRNGTESERFAFVFLCLEVYSISFLLLSTVRERRKGKGGKGKRAKRRLGDSRPRDATGEMPH